MTTLQEYLNNQYPTKEDKEAVTKISTSEITKPLEGGELDLKEFTNLEAVIITNLTTPLTKIEVDGLLHLKELILPDKPKEETEEEKKLYEELGISEDKQKQLIKEIERLTNSFTADKKINIFYATEKAPQEQLKEGITGITEKSEEGYNIFLYLERKDKTGNFCPNLVL
jgi:hypothetical protein